MAGYERQVKEMAVTLSSQEVAALTGKTERTVRRWAESGKIPAERVLNKFNSPEYLFSLDALEPHLQQKYFDGLKLTPSPEVAQTLTKEAKPLDTYSIEEQEEIAFWLRLVKQWQGYRGGRKLRTVVQAGISRAGHFRGYPIPPLERGAG